MCVTHMSVLFYPNESLIRPTLEIVHFNNEELNDLLQEMRVVLDKTKALGLAANQIGYNYSIFLMKDSKGEVHEFINPFINEMIGHQFIQEGCLSFPDIYVSVNRAKEVFVTAKTRTGEFFSRVAVDVEAVIIQHEVDHLNGITFLSKVSRNERKLILKKFKK